LAWDYKELKNRLSDAEALRTCLVCGSDDVDWNATRSVLVNLDEDDEAEIYPTGGLANGMWCAARVCNACGFVHLHATLPLTR